MNNLEKNYIKNFECANPKTFNKDIVIECLLSRDRIMKIHLDDVKYMVYRVLQEEFALKLYNRLEKDNCKNSHDYYSLLDRSGFVAMGW